MSQYDLYSEFDVNRHKETFTNYFEAIIYPNGNVEYAIPSHQEKLIRLLMKIRNCSRQDIFNQCPAEYYFNVIQWLCNETKCISCWYEGFICPESGITNLQLETIKILREKGVVKL